MFKTTLLECFEGQSDSFKEVLIQGSFCSYFPFRNKAFSPLFGLRTKGFWLGFSFSKKGVLRLMKLQWICHISKYIPFLPFVFFFFYHFWRSHFVFWFWLKVEDRWRWLQAPTKISGEKAILVRKGDCGENCRYPTRRESSAWSSTMTCQDVACHLVLRRRVAFSTNLQRSWEVGGTDFSGIPRVGSLWSQFTRRVWSGHCPRLSGFGLVWTTRSESTSFWTKRLVAHLKRFYLLARRGSSKPWLRARVEQLARDMKMTSIRLRG